MAERCIQGRSLVDLHSHILPGLDDGPRTEQQALEMLRIAAHDGIGTMVATPHAHHARAAATLTGVERLNILAREHGIDVTILPGSEIRIGPGIVERHLSGDLLLIAGGPYLLIELYLHDEWPFGLVERALDRILDAGLRPILAHVERYPFVQADPRTLLPFIERGIPLQINAGALSYREHDIERVTAESLLRARMAHLVASDAHNARYRPPRLRQALSAATAMCDPAYVCGMMETARTILAGEALRLPPAAPEQLDRDKGERG
jgi:protein-tyrosine phosphatase